MIGVEDFEDEGSHPWVDFFLRTPPGGPPRHPSTMSVLPTNMRLTSILTPGYRPKEGTLLLGLRPAGE